MKALLPMFGQMQVPDITGKLCVGYQRQRAADGVASRTCRTVLECLRAAPHWGLKADNGRLLVVMPTVDLPGKGTPRDRWLTEDEADALLDARRNPHLRLFIEIGLNTAERRNAILDLTWDRVDLERRVIDFRARGEIVTAKRKVAVPMNDTLHATLTAAQATALSPFVLERAGGAIASIRHGFASACVRAGLAKVTPHTLRHTAVMRLLHNGVSIHDAAGFAGMTPEMVMTTYGHHCQEHSRRAAQALERGYVARSAQTSPSA